METKLRNKKSRSNSEDSYWDCTVCTYRNITTAFKCLMCDVRKGTSTRKPRVSADIVAQQVAQQINAISSRKMSNQSKKVKKLRPRLKNVDRDSGQQMAVTVGSVTVIITDYKELKSQDKRSDSSSASNSTVSLNHENSNGHHRS